MRLAVYVGRFQPFHFGHLHAVRNALQGADRLLLVIGSSGEPRSTRNPWTAPERAEMIRLALDEAGLLERVIIGEMMDWATDVTWAASLRAAVRGCLVQLGQEGAEVLISGHAKDHTSGYLELFPEWGRIEVGNFEGLSATSIREDYFEFEWEPLEHQVPVVVRDWLATRWLPHHRPVADYLRAEFEAVTDFKAPWLDAPHPPTFITTDALVVHRGEVALIQRGQAPFRGRLAMPGGFLEPGLTLRQNALKEFGEETLDGAPADWLSEHLESVRTLDAPGRDPRGRFVSHLHTFVIPDRRERPVLKGGSDAEWAGWVPIGDVRREGCAFDHFTAITSTAGRFARTYAQAA